MLLAAAASLLLFQSEMSPAQYDELNRRTRDEMNAMMAAGTVWQTCLTSAADRYERSGEPANAVATAAIYECRRNEAELLEAQVIYRQASVPNQDARAARAHVSAQLEKAKVGHTERLTHYVVERRLGN